MECSMLVVMSSEMGEVEFMQSLLKVLYKLITLSRSSSVKYSHERRGRGHVTQLAAANNYFSAVTSRGWLLRYDLSEGEAPGKSLSRGTQESLL